MEEFPKRKELAFAQTAFRSSRKFLHFSSRSSTTCRSPYGGLNTALLVEVNGLLKLNIKIIQELEKRSDVSINSVTKRDPKTRKIVSMVKTFTVKDPTSRFIRAFEKDEEDAITAIKNLPKDEKRTYSLTTDRNGIVTLSVVIKLGKNHGSDLSFYFDFDSMSDKIEILHDELGCKL